MQTHIRYALGLYFIVSALEYIPASIFTVGVQNPYGPWWAIPAIPLAQGVVNAVAGVWLFRSGRSEDGAPIDLQWPTAEAVLQLFGVYSVVGGLVSLARPLFGVLLFSETIGFSAGASIASSATAIAIGAYLLARPHPLASYLRARRAA